MQFVIRRVLRGPTRRLCFANCCTRNAIARREGHYGNLNFRGFREDQQSGYVCIRFLKNL